MSDQAVFNANISFADRVQRMLGQQVEILMNAAGQGIFDGDDSEIAYLARHAIEDVLKGVAGDGLYRRPEDLETRALAERAQLALKGYGCASRDPQPSGTLH
jgi:hypothetical protein